MNCIPFFHKWSKWEFLNDRTVDVRGEGNDHWTERYKHYLRHCEKCGKPQTKKLRIS